MSTVDLYPLNPESAPELDASFTGILNDREVRVEKFSNLPWNIYGKIATVEEKERPFREQYKNFTLNAGEAIFDSNACGSEMDVLSQADEKSNQLPLDSNPNIPIFSSGKLPMVKTWGQWLFESLYMDYVADPEVLPEWPCNNSSMTFRTSGIMHPSMRIGGINGIGNSLWDAILHAEYLQGLAHHFAVE